MDQNKDVLSFNEMKELGAKHNQPFRDSLTF